MKSYSWFTIFLTLLVFSSCLTKKSMAGGKHGGDSGSDIGLDDKTLHILDKTQVPYTWFAGTGQGRIDWDGERYTVRFNVRILHDSIIWMQISKLGFEVGRMLVTPDSAFFINRLEHTYGKYRTNDFLRQYNVPADFEMFSKVFTAGAYIPMHATEIDKGDDGSIIVHGGAGVTAQHWFDANVLSKSYITDRTDHEWTAGYAEYQKTDTGQNFPYKRSNVVLINGQSNVFDLEYTNVVLDVPQQFPFSIPSHYEKQ
jgi:hypothetical protein